MKAHEQNLIWSYILTPLSQTYMAEGKRLKEGRRGTQWLEECDLVVELVVSINRLTGLVVHGEELNPAGCWGKWEKASYSDSVPPVEKVT